VSNLGIQRDHTRVILSSFVKNLCTVATTISCCCAISLTVCLASYCSEARTSDVKVSDMKDGRPAPCVLTEELISSENRLCQQYTSALLPFCVFSSMVFVCSGVLPCSTQNFMKIRCSALMSDVIIERLFKIRLLPLNSKSSVVFRVNVIKFSAYDVKMFSSTLYKIQLRFPAN
jgi:hypothetical protein